MARPKFAPKSTPSRGPIPKPHYLPHSCTRPTYDAKRHPNPLRRFSTMHWTDRRTNRPTDRPRESLITTGRCAPRATRPNNNLSTGNDYRRLVYSCTKTGHMHVRMGLHCGTRSSRSSYKRCGCDQVQKDKNRLGIRYL